jgi:hypothetical protein
MAVRIARSLFKMASNTQYIQPESGLGLTIEHRNRIDALPLGWNPYGRD